MPARDRVEFWINSVNCRALCKLEVPFAVEYGIRKRIAGAGGHMFVEKVCESVIVSDRVRDHCAVPTKDGERSIVGQSD